MADKQLHESERLYRQRLGIPEEAKKVLIFAESSHWDPNWMLTSEEYFERYVQENLDLALEELRQEPRRVYSIECVFFLRMYWDRSPDQRAIVRKLVNEGRLRLTSSGVTTADTIIPTTEAILRDFLLGQEWLRNHGMDQEPNLAYFTDSFGCSPALPSILNAAGFDRTTITRIDGMHFPGTGFRKGTETPETVSSAELLKETERSLDFIWRDRHGAEALCHWNAFTYGQGDMLASRGFIRLYHFPTSVSDQSAFNVTRRIHRYERQLEPLARTPYMFCPIGFDFVKPIPGLVSLLDRYNREVYPKTDLWVLNAGLDDYLELINFHRENLPVVELDPNPYWTGFYCSRPTLKRRSHDLVDDLVLAEQLSLLFDDETGVRKHADELQRPWWYAAVANHHDFITGTSPDRIAEGEQIPWLDSASLEVASIIHEITPQSLPDRSRSEAQDPPSLQRQNSQVHIETNDYSVSLSPHQGGTISRMRPNGRPQSVLEGPSNEVVSYRDSGGLWRMGYEFKGGTWKPDDQSSRNPVDLDIQEKNGTLEIASTASVRGQSIRQEVRFRNDSPLLLFRVLGRAASRHSYIVRFRLNLDVGQLVMDAPGGIISRPLRKFYDPTFWPLHRFVHLVDDVSGEGLALFQRYPGAVSYGEDGSLELVALRNAWRERAYRFLPLPGNPAKGAEKEEYAFEYALMHTPRGDWRENRLPEIAESLIKTDMKRPQRQGLIRLASSLFGLNRQDVKMIAAKVASRGDGWILRLMSFSAIGEALRLRCGKRDLQKAFLCDARERDIEELEIIEGEVAFVMKGTIATLRLRF